MKSLLKKKILNNSEKLFNTISLIYNELFQYNERGRSVLDSIGNSLQHMEDISGIDENLRILRIVLQIYIIN